MSETSQILLLTPPEEIEACVQLPPSKSLYNRMALLSYMAGKAVLHPFAGVSDDCLRMLHALPQVHGVVDVGGAGTAMRFLTAYYSATLGVEVVITGDERMCHRPMALLVESLRALGASVRYCREEGFPPLAISGRQLEGGVLDLSGEVSSQFISALLMVAPTFKKGLRLHLCGKILSRPYIELTVAAMRHFGVQVLQPAANVLEVLPAAYKPAIPLQEPDWTAASYWFEIVALARKAEVLLLDLDVSNNLQGDRAVVSLFSRLGVSGTSHSRGLLLQKSPTACQVFKADLSAYPDLAQSVVATCIGKKIPFHLEGLNNLRLKETDRLHALSTEAARLGCILQTPREGVLTWDGCCTTPPSPVSISTYADHRMAMSFAPLCLTLSSIGICHPEVVEKSYPHYFSHLAEAGFTCRLC